MTKPTDVLEVQPAGVVTGTPTPTITGQWRRDMVAIAGETGTQYTVDDDDFNTMIDYLETATNSQGTDSEASNSIPVDSAKPIVTTAPFVVADTDPPAEGTVYTATEGVYVGAQPITITRKWLADGVEIAGETGLTFTVTAAQVGATITYEETATNTVGNTPTVIDIGTGPVVGPSLPTLTTAPTISTPDDPVVVGSVITRVAGVWDDADAVVGEWHVNGIGNGNTTATYTVGASDEFDIVTWKERATNGDGMVIGTSNELGPVEVAKVYEFTSINTGGADAQITQSGTPAGQDDTIERTANAASFSHHASIRSDGFTAFSEVNAKYSRAAEVHILDDPDPTNTTISPTARAWLFACVSSPSATPGNPSVPTAATPKLYIFGPGVRGQYVQATGQFGYTGPQPDDDDVYGMKVEFLPPGDPLGSPTTHSVRVSFYKNGAILFSDLVPSVATGAVQIAQLTCESNAPFGRLQLVTDQAQMSHFAAYGADYDFQKPPLQTLTPPELLQEPVITAEAGRKSIVGTPITIAPGSWSPQPGAAGPVSVTGDLYRNGVVIPGTTDATTYTPVAADVGALLTYRERGTLDGRVSDYWSSDPVGPVTAS